MLTSHLVRIQDLPQIKSLCVILKMIAHTKVCNDCSRELPITSYSPRRRKVCHGCAWNRRILRDPDTAKKAHRRVRADRARAIFADSRKSDKLKGRSSDGLTVELIRSLIGSGCHYCGDLSRKMTIDRIENSKGHSSDNILPSCIVCNLVRGSMPYGAFVLLVPGLKQAFASGLLNGWTPNQISAPLV